MPAKVIVFDRFSLQSITLTKIGNDPVQALVSYEISGTNGEHPKAKAFSPSNIPAATQTQLNNLWSLADTAARAQEGI